ncbi:MAG: hypothetical protein Q4D38_08065 [Planctomycetia bacterium]|nr:hypothetical protein [Planctomycetia bacterium]
MLKSQLITIAYTAYNADTGLLASGDVANHTAKVSKDGASFTPCTNTPSEISDGVYKITLTATETNCNTLTLFVSSSTEGIVIPPVQCAFEDYSTLPTSSAVSTLQTSVNALPSSASVAQDVWNYASRVVTISGSVEISSASLENIRDGLGKSVEISAINTHLNETDDRLEDILTNTNRIPTNPAAVGDSMTLTSAYDNVKNFELDVKAIADAVLVGDISRVESVAPLFSLCSVVLAHFGSSVSEGNWTIFRTDGETHHASLSVEGNESAYPITGVKS